MILLSAFIFICLPISFAYSHCIGSKDVVSHLDPIKNKYGICNSSSKHQADGCLCSPMQFNKKYHFSHNRNCIARYNSNGDEGFRTHDFDNDIGIFSGIKNDLKRRLVHYKSDWTDGANKKTVAATIFMFFTCLAPTIAFGGMGNIITKGQMGVIEFIASCGISGMIYAIFSGQPMTFVGPTGLTLAFISTLFQYTQVHNLPFLLLYSWTGLWTALFLLIASAMNASSLIRFCTRFTDDCFNALLAINFIFEAGKTLVGNFVSSATGAGVSPPFSDPVWISGLASLNIAIATWQSINTFIGIKSTKLFTKRIRKVLSNFGPSLVLVLMTVLGMHPLYHTVGIQFLKVEEKFSYLSLLKPFPDLFSLPVPLIFMSMIPASLLTILFFLDHNISIRAVNSFKLKKGTAYHWDLCVLAVIVAIQSLMGLPWTCAATVQSLHHVRAMSSISQDKDESGREIITKTLETRLSGLAIHACIFLSLLLLPLVAKIPQPVVSGIFLYIGQKMMVGNIFLERLGNIFEEKKLLPVSNIFNILPKAKVLKFVSIQFLMLCLIWLMKQSKKFALMFPSCIAVLMLIRIKILPSFFSKEELRQLDPVV